MRRFALILVVVLVVALLSPSANASDDEPTVDVDGKVVADQPTEVRGEASTAEPLVFTPTGQTVAETPTILLDGSKGALIARPPTHIRSLIRLLNNEGYSVVITRSGILDEDLSQYDVFMALARFAVSPYSAAELDALDQYMNQGGNLFIAGEAQGCCESVNRNLNAITRRYGDIQLGDNTLRPTDYFSTNLRSHPIMSGIGKIYYRAGGALRVGGSATTVAFSNDGSDALVAVNDDIVVVGDTSFLVDRSSGAYWNRADNNAFIRNIFSYLIDGDDGGGPRLVCASLLVTISGVGNIVGTPGDDVILGSDAADTIDGGGGNDVICAGGGDDVVNGGAGADVMYGGAGDDRMHGQGDNDRMYGGPGNDVLWGNADNDIIGGGPGDDRVIGGPGDDSLGGGQGEDWCRGSAGADKYFACETKIV